MAILKYLGMLLYAARAAQTNTERTPLVPLVSIRELHEDFSGKVEDATCARKPELVNAHEDVLVVAGECSGYKDFVVAAEMSTAARERGDEPAFPGRASTPSRTSRRCWTRRPSSATRCRPIHRFARRRCLATRRRASASKVPRTTGGARSGTRTTTVRPILMMNAATRTGESNPRTSRHRSLRGPIPSPPPLSSFRPASHMVTKTESTNE